MACPTPSFEVEDQTDEDFFDKLINDDDDEIVGNGFGTRQGDVSNEANAFSDLTITEVFLTEAEFGFGDTGFNIQEMKEVGQDDRDIGSFNSNEVLQVASDTGFDVEEIKESGQDDKGIGLSDSTEVTLVASDTGFNMEEMKESGQDDRDIGLSDSNRVTQVASDTGFNIEEMKESGQDDRDIGSTDSNEVTQVDSDTGFKMEELKESGQDGRDIGWSDSNRVTQVASDTGLNIEEMKESGKDERDIGFSDCNEVTQVAGVTGFNIEELKESGQGDKGTEFSHSSEVTQVASDTLFNIEETKGGGQDDRIGLSDSNEVTQVANERNSVVADGVHDSSEVGSGAEESNKLASANEHIESNAIICGNLTGSSEIGVGKEGAMDGKMGKSNVSSGTGLKEVQWSSFNSSDSHDHGNGGFASYSDFFNESGDHTEDPFVDLLNQVDHGVDFNAIAGVPENSVHDLNPPSFRQNHDNQYHGVESEQNVGRQDLNCSHYWENLYPGWGYDPKSGQWYQLHEYNVKANAGATTDTDVSVDVNMNAQDSFYVSGQSASNEVVSNQNLDVYYMQQMSQSVVGNVAEGCVNASAPTWHQFSQGNSEYPPHMVFHPQYPGWYYHTIAQEWRSLESYTPRAQPVLNDEATGFSENKQVGCSYDLTSHVSNSVEQQTGSTLSGSVSANDQASHSVDWHGFSGSQAFISTEQLHQHNQNKIEPNLAMHFQPSFSDNQKSTSPPHHPLQTDSQFCYAPSEERSSAGRPPHTAVTFGFGGKIVVLKNNSSSQTNLVHGSQDSAGCMINVLNLIEVVMGRTDASSFGLGVCDYFHALCQQSFPGPLVGGNVGNKELNKWIDVRILNCESLNMNYINAEVLKLLFSLLKIACQHYGKLRSPFGIDEVLKEIDCPESAVAKLFTSAKRLREYSDVTKCLQKLPSDAQIQGTALEVQKLLVSGRKKEALECAQQGQLWGPALVLASQLGDQFYGVTVKQMALKQLAVGSPLRTLCLLIAGQPADVFSNATINESFPGYVNFPPQPMQIAANSVLDEWEENLGIITANRTKDDELAIIHLGDCLWKERGEVIAAHTCYLVAEANLEPYSDTARLCLIGADHWKFPRTYATPEAIQRTEIYEYSKVLGNPQFVLLPFQPYKLVYAYMLAEVGKVAESLKYCQVILKSLKTGRSPEVETWKQLVLSLEERLRTHQQGGYGTNLAPTKLVGKLLTFFDSTAHRVVGSIPPPAPSTSHGSAQRNGFANQPGGLPPTVPSTSHSPAEHYQFFNQPEPVVSGSQSTTAISSLVPSESVEPISGWPGQTNQTIMHNRSVSEPDFGRSPTKVNSSKQANSSDSQNMPSTSVESSRFGRLGSQLFQKTLGLVLRSRPDRQAKLGERNKFYFDEKLKRWVEEGAEPPSEEAVLQPPPTTSAFMNDVPDQNPKDATNRESFHSSSGSENKSPPSGFPPIPPNSNQFSARGRTGVRSRYVDTFNKGGGTTTALFQAPSISPAKPPGGASNPKFFIPTPTP